MTTPIQFPSQARPQPCDSTPSTSVYDVFQTDVQTGIHPINLALGNPHLKPPASYYQAMTEILQELQASPENGHGYLTKQDPFGLCQTIASNLTSRFGVAFQNSDIVITVGATGALSALIPTLIQNQQAKAPTNFAARCDEILVITPCFVEYLNLLPSCGARAVIVPSNSDFDLDTVAIADAITSRTCAILVNSPNNPTGRVYSTPSLQSLAQVLETAHQHFGHRITVIEDAVYDSLAFEREPPGSMISFYSAVVRINSYSKSLGLAGERLGYLAVHPDFATSQTRQALLASIILNQRIQVVHAPILQHRIVARMPSDSFPDLDTYRKNLDRLHFTLSALDFQVQRPQGTFYLWAKLPDDIQSEPEFRKLAHQGASPLLYLPGQLFGGDHYARYLRFAVCANYSEIERAAVRLHEIIAASLLQSAPPSAPES